ncbi:MAG: hypothetical protein A2Y64_05335 [Candidatus Coatesbacteria bacterium RBG_13_66_14]|uniref:Uncharacterized protein n=1 Tax=Candidatus Coatesbacteria bacterium RBG_13_66_14 TaxID=1817816 RepID=A0A1F5EYL7_9BACT|nr:MAG: hypothetical protein A2Y64_05335 [Candidatus Coatesbacteria bacterium RBG_13_66_14]
MRYLGAIAVVVALLSAVPALAFEDPFLPDLELGAARETVKQALQDDGYKLSWDEWCLWGTRDDLYDIAYCFGEYGELKSVEYHQRCPGDTWSDVYFEWRDLLVDLYGPKASVTDDEADYWSAGTFEIAMSLKYLDEADGLDPVLEILLTD